VNRLFFFKTSIAVTGDQTSIFLIVPSIFLQLLAAIGMSCSHLRKIIYDGVMETILIGIRGKLVLMSTYVRTYISLEFQHTTDLLSDKTMLY